MSRENTNYCAEICLKAFAGHRHGEPVVGAGLEHFNGGHKDIGRDGNVGRLR